MSNSSTGKEKAEGILGRRNDKYRGMQVHGEFRTRWKVIMSQVRSESIWEFLTRVKKGVQSGKDLLMK